MRAYRLGWWSRWPTLRWALLAGYALSTLLTFFNVWFSAKLMFVNPHDLNLAFVLLIFAGGMAMALGYFVSSAVADRIRLLMEAAGRLAEGKWGTRVHVHGRDELARLGELVQQHVSPAGGGGKAAPRPDRLGGTRPADAAGLRARHPGGAERRRGHRT